MLGEIVTRTYLSLVINSEVMGRFAERPEVSAEPGDHSLLGPLARSHGAERRHRARDHRPLGPAVLPVLLDLAVCHDCGNGAVSAARGRIELGFFLLGVGDGPLDGPAPVVPPPALGAASRLRFSALFCHSRRNRTRPEIEPPPLVPL